MHQYQETDEEEDRKQGGKSCGKDTWKMSDYTMRTHWTGQSGREIFITTPEDGKSPRRRRRKNTFLLYYDLTFV